MASQFQPRQTGYTPEPTPSVLEETLRSRASVERAKVYAGAIIAATIIVCLLVLILALLGQLPWQ